MISIKKYEVKEFRDVQTADNGKIVHVMTRELVNGLTSFPIYYQVLTVIGEHVYTRSINYTFDKFGNPVYTGESLTQDENMLSMIGYKFTCGEEAVLTVPPNTTTSP